MNIGLTISILRTHRRVNQKTLSELCGVTQGHINQVEGGKKQPSLILLNKISEALDVPLSIMMFLSISRKDIIQTRMESFAPIKEILDHTCNKVIGNEDIRKN